MKGGIDSTSGNLTMGGQIVTCSTHKGPKESGYASLSVYPVHYPRSNNTVPILIAVCAKGCLPDWISSTLYTKQSTLMGIS